MKDNIAYIICILLLMAAAFSVLRSESLDTTCSLPVYCAVKK